AVYSDPDAGGAQSCYYRTYAQCMQTISGIGGYCINSPYYGHGPNQRPRRADRPHLGQRIHDRVGLVNGNVPSPPRPRALNSPPPGPTASGGPPPVPPPLRVPRALTKAF